MNASIYPGRKWSDTEGNPISCHGFSVFYDEKEHLYHWYGEDKSRTKKGGNIWTYGISHYTSTDLTNWKHMPRLIEPDEDIHNPLHPTYCIDRPHIIYNEKTSKYVCWIKVMAGEIAQFFTILTADRFEGPYTYVHKFYNPLHMYCGDFCLHVDEETKKAYIWYERPHFQMICATLSEEYTEVTEEYSVHYDGLKPPYTREAPTYFERNGHKYLFTSGTSGYYPNPSRVCMFDDYHGEYQDLGDPFIGDKSNTSFSSQITSVIKLPGTEQYIACADRWVPGFMTMKMSGAVIKGMERHFADYTPDTTPHDITEVPGQLQKHNENTCKSTYVWLPIDWDGDKPVIRWRKSWSPREFM